MYRISEAELNTALTWSSLMREAKGQTVTQTDVARSVGRSNSVVSGHFKKLTHARFLTKVKVGGWERGPNYHKYLKEWGVK
jgi:predicted transcriptional regulator